MAGRPIHLGVVVLVVLGAGCNTVTPATSTPSPAVTAAPVPSAPPPSITHRWPPGVGQTGVVDPRELVAAHRTELQDTNYTQTVTESTRWHNGSVRWQRTRVTTTDENRVFVVLNRSGPSILRERSLNATRAELYVRLQPAPADAKTFAALTVENRTEYRTFTDSRHLLDNGRDIALLLSVFETRITSRTRRGARTVFQLEATGTPVVDRFRFVPSRSDVSDPRNAIFRLLVDDRGIVHQYRVAYTVTVEDGSLRYERIVRFSAIGTTSVRRPAWLDNVATATPTGTTNTDGQRRLRASGDGVIGPPTARPVLKPG